MHKLFVSILLVLASATAFAQEVKEMERPKLVVGIMVDQMRWDYLSRYYERYKDGGLRRLMSEGYNCNRLLINYIPTVTAVGHTSVYTGSVPAFTGIVANNFPVNGVWGTSVEDKSVKPVGTTTKAGKASPHNLLVTTMTDELRLATNFRSKTVGVALKDRAAILPAGHAANAAYWFDSKTLDFVTSSHYMDELPAWAKAFNDKNLPEKYLAELADKKKDKDGFWDLMYDRKTYVQSSPNLKERYFKNTATWIGNSPYGLILTTDMALAAIDGEKLGNNPAGVPDFLAVSYSSTDMVGHDLGPNAIWIEDMYLHLDQEIARILNHLDKKVGKGNYVVFLSADHAGSHNVEFRKDHNLPGGAWDYTPQLIKANKALKEEFGFTRDVITSMNACNIYFDNALIDSLAKARANGACAKDNANGACSHAGNGGCNMAGNGATNGGCNTMGNGAANGGCNAMGSGAANGACNAKALKKQVMEFTCEHFESQPEVAYCFDFRNIPTYVPEPVRSMAVNGYNPKRSGDLQIVLEANHTEDYDAGFPGHNGITRGTNHVVWSPYDAHIPFIVMGKGVRHAWDNDTHHVVDIAATICALLNIQQPSGCIGNAINVAK